ncbi:GGDEF domain-containing protein [Rhizorhabdus argentea]|uniref:GGDEF domain-containing protein n=1 Tax=Rhizorhabdus argentea TaxID=1387174 RepID=UPI0030EC837D
MTDAIYVELVRGLLSTLLLTLISGFAFAIVGAAAIVESRDTILLVLWTTCVTAAFVRAAVLLAYRHCHDGPLSARRAGQIERRFAWSYMAFAAAFGAFMARAFALGSADLRLLVVGMVFGHGASVAAGAVLRPWISLPAVLLSVLPTILTTFTIEDLKLWSVGALTLLYMGGGIAAMLRRYGATARRISLEKLFDTVSARDERTGLANQVALARHFEEVSSIHRPGLSVAVHVLHLDGFEDINSRYGYLAGDALLKEAAERLERLLSNNDFAARLGGIRFTVVQAALDSPRQAEVLASEIHQALSHPFAASGDGIRLTLSVGYSLVPQKDSQLEAVLKEACQACDRARLAGSGVARSFAVD